MGTIPAVHADVGSGNFNPFFGVSNGSICYLLGELLALLKALTAASLYNRCRCLFHLDLSGLCTLREGLLHAFEATALAGV